MLFDVWIIESDRIYVVAKGIRRRHLRRWSHLDIIALATGICKMENGLLNKYRDRIESIDAKLAEIKRLQIEVGDDLIGIANCEGMRRLAGRAMTASATCELAGIRQDLVREIR